MIFETTSRLGGKVRMSIAACALVLITACATPAPTTSASPAPATKPAVVATTPAKPAVEAPAAVTVVQTSASAPALPSTMAALAGKTCWGAVAYRHVILRFYPKDGRLFVDIQGSSGGTANRIDDKADMDAAKPVDEWKHEPGDYVHFASRNQTRYIVSPAGPATISLKIEPPVGNAWKGLTWKCEVTGPTKTSENAGRPN